MNLYTQFIDFIEKESLFRPDEPLLLAVSGGVDSVVLCELCHKAGFLFSIAHAHFGLRGADSDADAEFCSGLASKYNVRFYVKHFDMSETLGSNGSGIQQTARALRYNWFHELMEGGNGATAKMNHLLTAHHADDQNETILMNFLRGTGVSGLRGMLPGDSGIGGKVVRPLLFASKTDIVAFANKENLSWREDVSNMKADYTRNALRLNLIPQLMDLFPSLSENLRKNASRFRELEFWMDDAVQSWRRKNEIVDDNEIKWPVSRLVNQKGKGALLFELISPFGFSSGQLDDALQLLSSENSKYIHSPSHRLIKNRKWLILSPVSSQDAVRIPVLSANEEVPTSVGTFNFELIDSKTFSKESTIAEIDASLITYPLWIRPWSTGDYFYPLGLPKKKKISRFLIDKKLSKTDKERIWVVESDKKIIWIAGLRIDHRFRITDNTKQVLKISLVSSK